MVRTSTAQQDPVIGGKTVTAGESLILRFTASLNLDVMKEIQDIQVAVETAYLDAVGRESDAISGPVSGAIGPHGQCPQTENKSTTRARGAGYPCRLNSSARGPIIATRGHPAGKQIPSRVNGSQMREPRLREVFRSNAEGRSTQ